MALLGIGGFAKFKKFKALLKFNNIGGPLTVPMLLHHNLDPR
jgi:hypothetical protein